MPYFTGPNMGRSVAVIGRTSGGTAAAVPLIRQAVLALDADIPVFNVRTMDELLAQRRWQYRVFGGMFAIFAAIALLLAAVGLYAVMAYSVTQRTQEIGVRMVLGAPPGDVVWLFLRRAVVLVAVGLTIGMAGAFGVGRLLQSILVQSTGRRARALHRSADDRCRGHGVRMAGTTCDATQSGGGASVRSDGSGLQFAMARARARLPAARSRRSANRFALITRDSRGRISESRMLMSCEATSDVRGTVWSPRGVGTAARRRSLRTGRRPARPHEPGQFRPRPSRDRDARLLPGFLQDAARRSASSVPTSASNSASNPDTVRGPDIAFLKKEQRAAPRGWTRVLQGPARSRHRSAVARTIDPREMREKIDGTWRRAVPLVVTRSRSEDATTFRPGSQPLALTSEARRPRSRATSSLDFRCRLRRNLRIRPPLRAISVRARLEHNPLVRASFPEWVVPMAATLTDKRFTGPDWIFERKLDGIRLLAFKKGRSVQLFSRNRLPQHNPAIAEAIANLPPQELILDGEVTASGGQHQRARPTSRAASRITCSTSCGWMAAM